MSSLNDPFNMMEVDEDTKQIVRSYLSVAQHTLLSNNALLRIIPELVQYMVIHYYYRTHSIYEWSVDDPAQLNNIKNAVPGFSFNHHFKLHKLDWFLKFYPNGTKQSKQGNVFLLLYLRSTPEISRMSATCRVWLSELDKGREHYKDFNDKNKYTGWRSGLVKTSEIAPLRRMTFQVTVSIFEIYDQDGRNVTNKYIGLGIDAKQTISYLRKELLTEKQKVQRLTIEVDEFKRQSKPQKPKALPPPTLPMPLPQPQHPFAQQQLLRQLQLQQQSQSMPLHHSCFSSPSQSHSMSVGHFMPLHALPSPAISGVYRPHDIDDEKSLTYTSPNSPALPPLPALPAPQDQKAEDPCRLRFRKWLCETVKLGQLLERFRASECDDVRMIEFFEDAALEKEIGVARTFHRKLILKKAREFKAAQGAFSRLLDADAPEAKALRKHKDALERHGILSLPDLADLLGDGGADADAEAKADSDAQARLRAVLGDAVDAKAMAALGRFVRAQAV